MARSLQPLEVLYTCPGEEHPISRSVHLARLAAFYPACRECKHRDDTGQLSRKVIDQLERTAARTRRTSLLSADGFRGVYLNEMTRTTALEIGESLAAHLWAKQPPSAGRDDHPRPTVVVARDERLASVDLLSGVSSGLRRMGCDIVDVGRVSAPCFRFTVSHLSAAAGVQVTGNGQPASWTGLDLVGGDGLPWSQPGQLERIEKRLASPRSRPTRTAGRQETFRAGVPYGTTLWQHFENVPPVRVLIDSASPMVHESLDRLAADVPCELNLAEAETMQSFAQQLADAGAEVGVQVADDGHRCTFYDAHGRQVATSAIVMKLAERWADEHVSLRIALDARLREELHVQTIDAGVVAVDAGETRESTVRAIREEAALMAADTRGRVWFAGASALGNTAVGDAIVTIAKVLEASFAKGRIASVGRG